MCLITFAYKTHPNYKLILAANRDEFYIRPTRSAQFWKEENQPELLAGKDLEAGGTWMGITKTGSWGALTNYRDTSWRRETPLSRGDLVLDYLKNVQYPENYLQAIRSRSNLYNGFNLLIGNLDSLFHFSNHTKQITKIEPGIYGLSNAVLNTPWPKLEQAKSDLEKEISKKEVSVENLFQVLKNDTKAPDKSLPNTGIPKEWEKAISSIFIKTENYGTRCSTLLFIDHENKATFIERKYDAKTSSVIEENIFRLVFG